MNIKSRGKEAKEELQTE